MSASNAPPPEADPLYTQGRYFSDHGSLNVDHDFKASRFLALFDRVRGIHGLGVESYADVGCGTGRLVALVAEGLARQGTPPSRVVGYEVSPHVQDLRAAGVEFRLEDFSKGDESYDLVTLFDVFEHVPAPAAFLRRVAERCDVVGINIPLDDNLNNLLRDRFRRLLSMPGHLVFLDLSSALNLVAEAGIRVLDYLHMPGFEAPSGHVSSLARVLRPVRRGLFRLSPYLVSRTLGGTSVMLVGLTPRGLQRLGNS